MLAVRSKFHARWRDGGATNRRHVENLGGGLPFHALRQFTDVTPALLAGTMQKLGESFDRTSNELNVDAAVRSKFPPS
jgi:hypothetical protein